LIFGPAAESRLLAQGPKNRVKLENVNLATPHVNPKLSHGARSVAFSPDGKTLVAAYNDRDGTIRFWDVASGKSITNLKMGEVNDYYHCSVAFSPDGKTLASQGTEIILWDVASGKKTAVLGKNADTRIMGSSLAFSPDGKTLASGGAEIILWDVASGKKTATLASFAASLAISPDGKTLASGGGGHYSYGKSTLLSGGGVFLWDLASGKKINLFKDERNDTSVAISPDGKTLAAPGAPYEPKRPYAFAAPVRLWDIAAAKNTVNVKGTDDNDGPDSVTSVAFSADGKTLATGSMCVVRFWNVATGEKTAEFTAHTHWVHSMAFSPDGKTFASASEHGDNAPLVKLWDLTLFGPPSDDNKTASISGKWIGAHIATDGTTSEFPLEISEADGKVTGLWNKGAKIENGLRTGDTLAWNFRAGNSLYLVHGKIQDGGKSLSLDFTFVEERDRRLHKYTGTAVMKKSAQQPKQQAPLNSEEDAVRAIEKVGGQVTRDRDAKAPGQPVRHVNLMNATWVTDGDLKPLREFKGLLTMSKASHFLEPADGAGKSRASRSRARSACACVKLAGAMQVIS
jgi:WD40 repeat protein